MPYDKREHSETGEAAVRARNEEFRLSRGDDRPAADRASRDQDPFIEDYAENRDGRAAADDGRLVQGGDLRRSQYRGYDTFPGYRSGQDPREADLHVTDSTASYRRSASGVYPGTGAHTGMAMRGDDFAELPRAQGPHAGRGPVNYRRPDSRILEDVCDFLTDDAGLDASQIEVQVNDREVTLDGMVDSKSAKRRAEDLAEQVSAVQHVQNNLRIHPRTVAGKSGEGQKKQDSSPVPASSGPIAPASRP